MGIFRHLKAFINTKLLFVFCVLLCCQPSSFGRSWSMLQDSMFYLRDEKLGTVEFIVREPLLNLFKLCLLYFGNLYHSE